MDGEEGKVLSEVQRGYMLHDRVLRPAMVVVGRGTGEQGTGEQGNKGTVEQGNKGTVEQEKRTEVGYEPAWN